MRPPSCTHARAHTHLIVLQDEGTKPFRDYRDSVRTELKLPKKKGFVRPDYIQITNLVLCPGEKKKKKNSWSKWNNACLSSDPDNFVGIWHSFLVYSPPSDGDSLGAFFSPDTFGDAVVASQTPGNLLFARSELVFPTEFPVDAPIQFPMHCRAFYCDADKEGITRTCMDVDVLFQD